MARTTTRVTVDRAAIAGFVRTDDDLAGVFRGAADAMVQAARSAAPVDTGRLRDSIDGQVRKTADGPEAVVIARTDYAAAVDAKQPFLTPALYVGLREVTS